jgi:hypothetical protein
MVLPAACRGRRRRRIAADDPRRRPRHRRARGRRVIEVRTTFFNAGAATHRRRGLPRMAILPGAIIISRFATMRGESTNEAAGSPPAARKQVAAFGSSGGPRVGWRRLVRATVRPIAAGATGRASSSTTSSGFAPCLQGRRGLNLIVQYRYPMVSDATPPSWAKSPSARVDAAPSSPDPPWPRACHRRRSAVEVRPRLPTSSSTRGNRRRGSPRAYLIRASHG